MTTLDTIIGPRIAGDLTTTQTSIVWNHIHQNEPGVRRVAAQILANPSTRNPTPVLLAALKRGQHLTNPRTEHRNLEQRSILDQAEALYHRKLAHLNEHGALAPEGEWTTEDALAYAIDYTKGATSELDNQLRERVGLPPYEPVPAPEAWTQILTRLAQAKTEP